MNPTQADKKPVRVNIFNQSYTILSGDDPEEVERLATRVDDLMRTYARAGNIDTTRAAVLCSLHLADQLRTIERELNNLRERIDLKSKELTVLLDQVIE